MSSENMKIIKLQLEQELKNYTDCKEEFTPFYPGMNILTSNLYKEQLKSILLELNKENLANEKSFAMYLETVIINMHTKAKKYKKSLYFDDDNIKDIVNQGCTIPFYIDEKKNRYIILGILQS